MEAIYSVFVQREEEEEEQWEESSREKEKEGMKQRQRLKNWDKSLLRERKERWSLLSEL